MQTERFRSATRLLAATASCFLPLTVVAGPAVEVAAGDPAALEEIVVVATKRESSIRDVAADVAVLSRAELEDTLTTSLADALRFTPGVSHQGGGTRFGAEGVTVRGIGGNRITLEVDGVPVSEHFRIGSFASATRDLVDTSLLDRIEILKGPASALYGGSALGGVVSMRTPDPRRFVRGGEGRGGDAAAIWHGADKSRHIDARFALAGEPVSLLLAGSARDGEAAESAIEPEVTDERDYRRRAGLLKLTGDNRLRHRWQLMALSQTDEAGSSIRSVLGSGRFRSTTNLSGDDRSEFGLVSGEYEFGSADGWVDEGLLRVYAADADIVQRTLDERKLAPTPSLISREFSFGQRIRGAELNLWKEGTVAGWSQRAGFGLDWTERRTAELRDGKSESLADGQVSTDILGESFPLRDFPPTVTREFGAWLSEELSRGPLTLMLALRFDASRLSPRADAIYLEDNPDTTPVAVSVSDMSPKLGAIYRVGADVDIYLQYAQGFRAPPFEDANIGLDIPLFNIRAIPNPDLRSESSRGWEVGLRRHTPRSRLRLGLFHTDYADFIESKARIGVDAASGRLLFQSRNIERASIRGIEGHWEAEFGGRLEGLSVLASAYWAQGENSATGAPLNTVGPAEAVIGIGWRSQDETSSARLLARTTAGWSSRDKSGGELFEPAGATVVDLYVSKRLGTQMTLRAGIGNLTDRVYWHWTEIRGLAPDDPLLPVLARPGRNYSIGLSWDW